MNQLNYGNLGGWKLESDDLQFYHNAIKEGFEAVYFMLGRDFLSGAVITSASLPGFDIAISWAEGYLWHNGEFYHIAAGGPINFSSGGDDELYIKVIQEFDPAGAELNKTGSPINTYIVRRATIDVAAVGSASVQPGFVALYNTIHTSNPKTIVVQTGYENIAGNQLRYKCDGHKTVKMFGQFKLTSATPTGGNLTTTPNRIPANLRPASAINRLVLNTSAGSLAQLTIGTDGSISLFTITGAAAFATNHVIDVGNIEWSV